MASLDIAHEYEAVIVDSLTQETLLHLPWGEIVWQRIAKDVSAATVTLPIESGGLGCCGVIGGLFGWSQMLRIERNGETVWDGPILGWARDKNSHDGTIRAWDRSALFWKRLVTTHRQYTNEKPWSIITQVAADAGVGNASLDPYTVSVVAPTTYPVELVTREYFVERLEQIYSVFKELTDATETAFWTTLGQYIYLDAQTIATAFGLAGSGGGLVLNETDTIGLPGIDVNCRDMATVTYAGGSGQGLNGYPLIQANSGNAGIFLSSYLQSASPQTQSAATADLALIAGRAAAQYLTPDATAEQFQLAPNFGGDILARDLSNLLPGVQFDIDDPETCAFAVPVSEYRENAGVPGVAYVTEITRAKMSQLDVTVKRDDTGISEVMYASLRPIISNGIAGTTGAATSDTLDTVTVNSRTNPHNDRQTQGFR